MSWSYDPSQVETKDRVRFEVGDTDEDNPQVKDEEIVRVLELNSDNVLSAAIVICEHLATKYATRFDFTSGDGSQFKASQMAEAFTKRADALRKRAGGLRTIPTTRVDGYNATDEIDNEETDSTQSNPRRRYYGEPDRMP